MIKPKIEYFPAEVSPPRMRAWAVAITGIEIHMPETDPDGRLVGGATNTLSAGFCIALDEHEAIDEVRVQSLDESAKGKDGRGTHILHCVAHEVAMDADVLACLLGVHD